VSCCYATVVLWVYPGEVAIEFAVEEAGECCGEMGADLRPERPD
jgi:hypothetical protein